MSERYPTAKLSDPFVAEAFLESLTDRGYTRRNPGVKFRKNEFWVRKDGGTFVFRYYHPVALLMNSTPLMK
jgi:hypothetical protein